jgi:hypothetical protein
MLNALILGLYELETQNEVTEFIDFEDCHGYEITDASGNVLDNYDSF